MYTPVFTCEHCGKDVSATVYAEGQGILVPCDCQEAREAWEREHRTMMEARRKRRKL